MRTTLFFAMVMFTAASILSRASAEDWPGWRGPRGDGTSIETQVPTRWNGTTGENIRWKTPITGQGHSSPIIWKNRVFLTTCIEQDQQRALICLDASTGKELWTRQVLQAPLESRHQLNSFASGTPATDGNLIYVAFLKVGTEKIIAPNVGAEREIFPGRVIVSAVDFDGELKWQVDVGDFVSAHGFCSCPVLYGNTLILNGDHDGEGYLVALDKSTGKEVWRAAREHGTRSYVTPIVRTVDGHDQLVMSGSKHIASFNPQNGEMIWKVEGPTEQYVASMVFDGERFFMAAGFPTHHVMAILPDGKGDVTDTHVAWHVDKYVKCYVPSPVVLGRRLFVADDRGTASCFDARDGLRIWQERMGGTYSASLVATPDHVYFLSDDGKSKVIAATDEFKLVAENSLGEHSYASPAISGNQLYIRGVNHLFCIGSE